MKQFDEIYVPTGWIKTSEETPLDPDQLSWPSVEETRGDNRFELSIAVKSQCGGDRLDTSEKLTLSFVNRDDEIVLIEDTSFSPKQGTAGGRHIIANEGGVSRERTFSLKVFNKDINATMFYEVKLNRVEVGKSGEASKKGTEPFGEHSEVRPPRKNGGEAEDPFGIEFDDPKS